MKYDKRFYEGYPETNAFAGDVLSKEIVRQTRKYIKGDCLDVGAGSGAMMGLLAQLDNVYSVSGIDIAPQSKLIKEGSSDNMPFEGNSFDTVIWSEVIEHLDDDILKGTLKEINRVMCPGAHLIITTPYIEQLSDNMVTCPACKEKFHRWGHVRSYDAGVMLEQISPFFKVIKIYHTSLGFLNAHPKLWVVLPIINAMGFLKNDEHLICIAKKFGCLNDKP